MYFLRVLIIVASHWLMPLTVIGQPAGNLENPSNGGYYGGIQIISGWVCEADSIEVLIDGTQYLKPAYGTPRLDTQATCGDVDNGFGLLVNLSNLGSGEHEAVLFADGQEVDRALFTVTALTSGEFATDLEDCVIVTNFPSVDQELALAWSEASQNFQIRSERNAASVLSIEGLWSNNLNNLYFWASREIGTGACGKEIEVYVTGYMGVNSDMPQKIDLVGTGKDGTFTTASTGWDPVYREVRFEISDDGSMSMKIISCPGGKICEKTPEGSELRLSKVLNPFDRGYMPPLSRP